MNSIEIKQIDNKKELEIKREQFVTLKSMGNIYEITCASKRNGSINIQLLDKDNFVDLRTGEVKACNHIDNRSENKSQVAQSLKRLRDYINTNVVEPNKCKWITLTYKENMQDTKKLYVDFKRFITRLKRLYNQYDIQYIVACEPQGRGAWHMHLILIFKVDAPFIPNEIIERLWGQGFTKTNKLNDIDNIGAYLTAYLGDMELNNTTIQELKKNGVVWQKLPIKEISEDNKRFLKGARLFMYPPKFNIYRMSRGIKKPNIKYLSYHVAKEKIGVGSPTFVKGITLNSSDNKFHSKIIYEYYNTKR